MKRDDKQHLKLQAEAGKHSMWCDICYRHWTHHSHTLSHNLLSHLISAHGYMPKRWWQFWK